MKVIYMKKFLMGLMGLAILTVITVYFIYSYKNEMAIAQKINREYKAYENVEILGSQLISIINRTIDINHKNEIPRDSNGYYVDNGEKTIRIYIKFVYKNETKTIQMEEIEKTGTEAFIKMYSTASFKCTNIEYHSKTNNVKHLTFEEISENH